MSKFLPSLMALILAMFFLATPLTTAESPAMKWTFFENDAGTSTFQSNPDGTFESLTELNLAGTAIKSRLTGKLVDGRLVEFEMVTDQAGTEAKTSGKEGKAQVVMGERKREVEFKPARAVFGNFHPDLSATILKAFDPAKGDTQTIEVFVIDAAATIKVDVSKMKQRSHEAGGVKQIVDEYHVKFPGVEFDMYVGEDSKVVAWDVPSQKLRAIKPGFENLFIDPTTLYPELSQPTFKTNAEKNVQVEMRDGVRLAVNITRPVGEGKYPAILERTPYGKDMLTLVGGEFWAKRGYVHIAQDVRGRNDSDGDWTPFVNERKDGYDTVQWIAGQAWSDGKVGMIGGSYGGWVQWAAAVENPPALQCMVPQVSPPDLFFNFPIDHGIPMLFGAMWWSNFVKDKRTPQIPELPKDIEKLKTLPLSKVDDELFGRNFPFFDQWLEKQTPAAFAGAGASFMADMGKVKIPVLHISGWWDGDGIGTKLNWARLQSLGHKDQWLIYGPWTHAFNTKPNFKDVDYGPAVVLELDSVYLRWFDTCLKGKQAKWTEQPKVRAFVTGANEWRELTDWPDPRSKEMTLYFSSNGPANGVTSFGELVAAPPREQEPDRYTYNPAGVQIPKELKELRNFADLLSGGETIVKIEPQQNDVLVYKSAPMTEPLEIAGPIEVDLYFSTTAKDTDFFAALVDIEETGVMRRIGLPGTVRTRYLSGWDKPLLLAPGRVYKATLHHWDTAHQFKKGHRLGVLIYSEMFPAYARNLNTGEPIKDATRMVAAHQTIYHDTRRPSALRFRVLPPGQSSNRTSER
jgi:putative CocE/NonD family hydrolase